MGSFEQAAQRREALTEERVIAKLRNAREAYQQMLNEALDYVSADVAAALADYIEAESNAFADDFLGGAAAIAKQHIEVVSDREGWDDEAQWRRDYYANLGV